MKNATGLTDKTKMHLQIVCCGWTKKVLLDGVCIFEVIEDANNVGRIYLETWQAGVTLGTPQYIEYPSDDALKAEHQAELDMPCVNKSEAQILSDAKAAAKTTVSEYLQDVETSYSEVNQAVIAEIISQGNTVIDNCKSVEEVEAAVEAVKTQLDAVMTIEQETALSDAKTAAKAEIEGYLKDVETSYSEENQALIASIIEKGKTDIDACVDENAIASVVAEVKEKLASVKTINQESSGKLAEDFKAICSNVVGTPVDGMEVKDGKLVSDTNKEGVGTNFKFGNQTDNMNKVFDAYMTIDYRSAEWS